MTWGEFCVSLCDFVSLCNWRIGINWHLARTSSDTTTRWIACFQQFLEFLGHIHACVREVVPQTAVDPVAGVTDCACAVFARHQDDWNKNKVGCKYAIILIWILRDPVFACSRRFHGINILFDSINVSSNQDFVLTTSTWFTCVYQKVNSRYASFTQITQWQEKSIRAG